MANETTYLVFSVRDAGADSQGAELAETRTEGEYNDRMKAFTSAGDISVRDNVPTYVVKRERTWTDTVMIRVNPEGQE